MQLFPVVACVLISSALVAQTSNSSAGKSSAKNSPSRVTISGPACWVAKVTSLRSGLSQWNTTKAEASVAWPHRSTSVVGVNQRSR